MFEHRVQDDQQLAHACDEGHLLAPSGVRSCFVRVDELDSVTWCVRLALHFRGRCTRHRSGERPPYRGKGDILDFRE